MDKVNGSQLNDMKQWRCEKNKDHILGVIERVEAKLQVNGTTLRYRTSQLIIFREAVDRGADIPAEIDVAGTIDGKMLIMIWTCTVKGCGCINEWHPGNDVIEFLMKTYLAE